MRQERLKFKMPRKSNKRKVRCDGCGRKRLSVDLTVRGIYVYCPKCEKARVKREKAEAKKEKS